MIDKEVGKASGKQVLRYSICVSGAAGGPTIKESHEAAEKLGKAIAEEGHILTTGATVGPSLPAA